MATLRQVFESLSLDLTSVFVAVIGLVAVTIAAILHYPPLTNRNVEEDLRFDEYQIILRFSILTIVPFSVLICSDLVQASRTKTDAISSLVAKIIPAVVIVIPNTYVLLRGERGSNDKCAVAIQLFLVSHIIIHTAMKNDGMLSRNRKWRFMFCSIANSIAFLSWSLDDNSRLWLSMGVIFHSMSSGIIVHRLYQLMRHSNKVALASASNHTTQSKKSVHTRWNSCCNYFVYLVLIIATWALSAIKEQTAGLSLHFYLMYCAAISCMVLGDRAAQASIKLVSIAADLNRGFVRFISHELLSHLNHLCAGLEQLANESSCRSLTDSSRRLMVVELQHSCDSSVQILNDVLIFDGLRTDDIKKKERTTVNVNRLIRRVVKELEPLVRFLDSE